MNGHDAEEFRFVPVQVYLLELVYLVVGESEIAVPDDGLGLGPALYVWTTRKSLSNITASTRP